MESEPEAGSWVSHKVCWEDSQRIQFAAECNLPFFVVVWLQLSIWQSMNVASVPRTKQAEKWQREKEKKIFSDHKLQVLTDEEQRA